jgi:hypothetical protein
MTDKPGFVVKATPRGVRLPPRWLMPSPSSESNFGPRDKAKIFRTHDEASAEAWRWETMLSPTSSITADPA